MSSRWRRRFDPACSYRVGLKPLPEFGCYRIASCRKAGRGSLRNLAVAGELRRDGQPPPRREHSSRNQPPPAAVHHNRPPPAKGGCPLSGGTIPPPSMRHPRAPPEMGWRTPRTPPERGRKIPPPDRGRSRTFPFRGRKAPLPAMGERRRSRRGDGSVPCSAPTPATRKSGRSGPSQSLTTP